MEFITEYALLAVVAAPVAVIVAMNAVLALSGESGTLILPSTRVLPPLRPGAVDLTPAASAGSFVGEAANDEIRTAA